MRTTREQCRAIVRQDWSSHQCTKPATTERVGVPICGQHGRVFDRWDNEGRGAAMVEFWWRVPVSPKED